MSHRRKEVAKRIAQRNRNTSLGTGALAILFGAAGLARAVRDFRAGDLVSGTAAASQQPYATFLRLVCFCFLILVGLYFIGYSISMRKGLGFRGRRDE